MFIRPIAYLATAVAVGTFSFVGFAKAFPDQATALGDIVRDNITGWDEWACKASPAGCLENRYNRLASLEIDVGGRLSAIRAQRGSVSAMVDEQQSLVSRNAALVSEGKALFKQFKLDPSRQLEFVGKIYPSAAIFEQQLALLFKEKKAREANLANSRALEAKLRESEEQLMIHSSDISLAKQMIPAQIALVKANRTLADFGENLTMINDIIKGSEVGLADTDQLIRTTAELMEPGAISNAGATVDDPEFRRFMAE